MSRTTIRTRGSPSASGGGPKISVFDGKDAAFAMPRGGPVEGAGQGCDGIRRDPRSAPDNVFHEDVAVLAPHTARGCGEIIGIGTRNRAEIVSTNGQRVADVKRLGGRSFCRGAGMGTCGKEERTATGFGAGERGGTTTAGKVRSPRRQDARTGTQDRESSKSRRFRLFRAVVIRPC